MKFSEPTKFEKTSETYYDFPRDVKIEVEDISKEIPGFRHCVEQFFDEMEDEDQKELLKKLAQKIPSMNYQEIFEKGVLYGWREIADQCEESDDFEDMKLMKLKAQLHAKKPTQIALKALPEFNTETYNNGTILVLDSSSKFSAESKANLKYQTNIQLSSKDYSQSWEKELTSEDFDVTITAKKLCFELAHQPAQHPRPQPAQQLAQQPTLQPARQTRPQPAWQPAQLPRPQPAQQPTWQHAQLPEQQPAQQPSQQSAHHMKCGICVQLINLSVLLPSLGSIVYGIYLALNSEALDDELGDALVTVGTSCLFISVVGLFGACPCIDIFIIFKIRLLKLYFYLLIIGFFAFIGYGFSFHTLISTKSTYF